MIRCHSFNTNKPHLFIHGSSLETLNRVHSDNPLFSITASRNNFQIRFTHREFKGIVKKVQVKI